MAAAPRVSKVSFEHHHDGFGLGHSKPRLSWSFIASDDTLPGWTQTGYELEIEGQSKTFLVESDQSILVPWPAEPLVSRARAAVRVRVRGNDKSGTSGDTSSDWSEPAIVEAGLLKREDWVASFIAANEQTTSLLEDDQGMRPLRFRKEFTLDAASFSSAGSRARLYITGLGVYKAYINGQRTSNEEMAPGWTDYTYRLNYRVHDVTSLLRAGETNVIAVEIAEGWYAGRLGWNGGTRFIYGKDLGVLAQLEITSQANASSQPWCMSTDTTWNAGSSPIRSSSIYDGEAFDAREDSAKIDWAMPLQQATNENVDWGTTRELPWPGGELVAPDAAPVRVTKIVDAVSVFQSESGKSIVDFGQNLVGKVQLQEIDLPRDGEVTLKHAEVMENGELGTRPLRLAKATDTIVSAGQPLLQWTPQFTFHGFRYVQVDGLTQPLAVKENFKALVMHTDLKRRGEFTCSNDMVNQLHRNIRWSMDGNFLSIPTDCPQRDERLGWTGDIQVFSPTANFLYDTTGMLKDWLLDLQSEQMEFEDFIPPFVSPSIPIPGWPHMPAAIWDDVVVLTPYDLYQSSGDRSILEQHFVSMRGWLEKGVLRDPTDNLWDQSHWQLGDWLDPKAPADDAAGGATDDVLVADEYLCHVTTVFADVCRVLGKTEEHTKYAAQAAQLKQSFQNKYISPAGNLMSNTQTGLSLAVRFGLYRNENEVETTAQFRLDKLVRREKFHIATGFAGTPAILGALMRVRRPQLAYRMLLETTCPSWLYPVTMGATTVWERWDSMLPDGRINPGSMTSFNHYALGAVADWLHSTVGGITTKPGTGWRTVLVRPVPGGDLTSANVSFDGPYGMVSCEWRFEEQRKFSMKLIIPPNSAAEVTLPSELNKPTGNIQSVGSGTHHFTCDFDPGEWPPQPLGQPQ